MTSQRSGVFFGLAAFLAWGFLPAYWKQLQAVAPFEILCHRIIWSCLFLTLIISIQGRWGEVGAVIGERGKLIKLCLSGMLIGFNWFIYILAVNTAHVVETSLGYYITPMVNALLGFILLGERFSRMQWLALVSAALGVGYSLLIYGRLPVYALTLAFSFAFYGFARKKIQVAPIPGLLIETGVLLLPALGFVVFRQFDSAPRFLHDIPLTLWLIGAGVVTSLPLLWFASAARRLRLSTVGILQYLAPSIAFGLGVFVYHEPFARHNLVTFLLIWLGVFMYCGDTLRRGRYRPSLGKRS